MRLTDRASAGLLALLVGGVFLGRAARGSAFPRKATCQVLASGIYSFWSKVADARKAPIEGPP